MKNKFLPIGTVCDIKSNNKKIMIIGYCVSEFSGDLKIKDYAGCAYPEGLLLPSQILSFNHDDITNVHFLGFKNEEQERLDSLLNKYSGNDIQRAKEFHEDNDMYLTSNKSYSKLLFDENGVVMLAEQKTKPKVEFDEDGYVINVESEEVTNPFYNKSPKIEIKENNKDYSKWNIFNKIEFDENGTVVEAQTTVFGDDTLNKIEFDENGVVISDGTKKIEQSKKYEFDEDGVLTDINNDEVTQEIPPIGPGLPGYEEPTNKKTSNYNFDEEGNLVSEETYEFDVNGNLVSINNSEVETEEEIPAIGPGLPGYVEPANKKTSNYNFDEEGNLVSEETYEFDVNGNLVSINNSEVETEEEIPAIGPGLPGYVAPVQPITSGGFQFDANGNVIASTTQETSTTEGENGEAPAAPNYQFDENGILISA